MARPTSSKGNQGGGDGNTGSETKKRVRWNGPSLSSAPQRTDDPAVFKANVVSGTRLDTLAQFVKDAVKAAEDAGATSVKGTLTFTGPVKK